MTKRDIIADFIEDQIEYQKIQLPAGFLADDQTMRTVKSILYDRIKLYNIDDDDICPTGHRLVGLEVAIVITDDLGETLADTLIIGDRSVVAVDHGDIYYFSPVQGRE